MAHEHTLFWYDFETWGAQPLKDRPAQFAGIRTDLDLNIIGEPVNVYCQLADDYLPHPEACLITGLTPQKVNAQGLPEAEFIKRIDGEFSRPGTCALGYNSIRFDDEVTRATYYRNFFDPYQREWRNGNSRWDLIDIVRACHALRPQGINWPTYEDGRPCFKLEELTKANNISHESAHDAMSDVYATIAMAKLIKQAQPKLYQFLFANRGKKAISAMLDVLKMTPVVHISSKLGVEQQYTSWMAPLCYHPDNHNQVITVNLAEDPQILEDLSVEELKHRLFTPSRDLPDDTQRPPIKGIHINRCPVVAPAKTLTPDDARLGIPRETCLKNLAWLKARPELREKIAQLYLDPDLPEQTDPDFMLYGGFFSDSDKRQMELIRTAAPDTLGQLNLSFEDPRLKEMLFRYRARNYPYTLTPEEQSRWQDFRRERLADGKDVAGLSMQSFGIALENLAHEHADDADKLKLLQALYQYAEQL